MAEPQIGDGGKQKTADRPHQWTVALSLFAAAISLGSATLSWLSLQETRENRRINEQTARAYLTIASLVVDSSIFSRDRWAGKTLTGFVTVTNTGRVSAHEINTLLDLNPPRTEMVFNIARFSDLPPGTSGTVRFLMKLDQSKSMTMISDAQEFVFGARVKYVDGFAKEQREQDLMFCAPVSKTKATGMVTLYPCDTHFAPEH